MQSPVHHSLSPMLLLSLNLLCLSLRSPHRNLLHLTHSHSYQSPCIVACLLMMGALPDNL